MGKIRKKQKGKLEFTEDYRPIRKVPVEIKNNAPKEIDDSQTTRKIREIQKLKELSKNPIKKETKKKVNPLEQIAQKYGFVKRRGETYNHFKNRILWQTSKSINEDLQKVRFGLAGRDVKEIKAEYKELDEKAKKKKALKILMAERKKNKKQKKQKQKPKSSSLFSSDDEESSDNDMEEDANETDNESEDEKSKEKNDAKITNKELEEKNEEKKKKLTKNDKIRIHKKEEKKFQEKELLLDAKEVIQFGERVDAPPQFNGKFKKLNDSSNKAGAKDLLLKTVLQNNNQHTVKNDKKKKQKVDDEERQKVIEMYRQLKKTKKL